MARGNNLERVQRLRAAAGRAKKGDLLSLTELAMLQGVSKGAFVNLRQKIATFPEPQQGEGNSLLYDAVEAIKALLEYETRSDEAEQERQSIAAKIMGMDKGRGRRKKEEVFLPPSEMMKLSRLRAEIEERERKMGEYIPAVQVRQTASRIYSVLNEHLSQLESRVDPNGLLSSELRERIAKDGRAALLAIHKDLSDTLGVDVDDRPSRTSQPRKKAQRPKRAQARR